MVVFNLNNFISIPTTMLTSLAIIIIVVAILAFLARLLKQELIIAYILAGIVLGPLIFGFIEDKSLISNFAEIGIAFLLFIAGLEMSAKKIKENILASTIIGILQVALVTLFGYFILVAFGFGKIEALLLGAAISFSSTIVVLKLLSDRREMETLHGRIIVGIMLVQDIIALLLLAFMQKNYTTLSFLLVFLKAAFLCLLAILINITIKGIIKKTAEQNELLFIFALALLFLFSSLAYFLNFSIAIGAFIAGVVLANTHYRLEIESRMKSLKDFFIILFFVMIGLWLTSISKNVLIYFLPILFILIILEPLITAIMLMIAGYNSKLSLDVGFSFAQISEFTLILAIYGLSLGVMSQKAFDLVALTAIISIALTPYTMKISRLFYKPFSIFDRRFRREEQREFEKTKEKTILIVGCHRMGSVFLDQLSDIKHKLVVIDYNPKIVEALRKKGIQAIYGNASDLSFIEMLHLENIRVAILTLPKMEDNLILIKYLKKNYIKMFIAVIAQRIDDALELYKYNADFVIMPYIISAEHSIKMLKKYTKKELRKIKKKHIKYLQYLHRVLY